MTKEHDMGDKPMSADDLRNMNFEAPKVSNNNVWEYDPELMTLSIHRPHAPYPPGRDYEVDLEEVTTAESVVDWIAHLSDKEWFQGKIVSDFIESLVVYLPLWDLASGKGPIDAAGHLRQFNCEQRADNDRG